MVLGTSLFFTRFYIFPAFLLQLFQVCYPHISITCWRWCGLKFNLQLNYANWATSSQPHRITFEKDVVLHSKPREYSNLKRRQLKFTYIHNNQRHQDVSNYKLITATVRWVNGEDCQGRWDRKKIGAGGVVREAREKGVGDGSTKRAGSGKITRGRPRNNSAS